METSGLCVVLPSFIKSSSISLFRSRNIADLSTENISASRLAYTIEEEDGDQARISVNCVVETINAPVGVSSHPVAN